MKTPDGYRFSLQFAANSPEYIQAGETLESLKHKKSDFIVRAVCEYLERHPDIETGAVVRIEVRRELFRRDELEKIVRSMIQQYVSNAGQQAPRLRFRPGKHPLYHSRLLTRQSAGCWTTSTSFCKANNVTAIDRPMAFPYWERPGRSFLHNFGFGGLNIDLKTC